jgi:hypothetical protein
MDWAACTLPPFRAPHVPRAPPPPPQVCNLVMIAAGGTATGLGLYTTSAGHGATWLATAGAAVGALLLAISLFGVCGLFQRAQSGLSVVRVV